MPNNKVVARVSIILLIILILTFFNMPLQARNLLQGHPLILRENNVVMNHHRLFHRVVIDLSKHIHIADADADAAPHKDGNHQHRLSPGGPDPQHNNAAPPSK